MSLILYPDFVPTTNRWIVSPPHKREFFLLPTGAGSVLYRPQFFHPIVFNRRLRELTKAQDDLTFRLGRLLIHVVRSSSSHTDCFPCSLICPCTYFDCFPTSYLLVVFVRRKIPCEWAYSYLSTQTLLLTLWYTRYTILTRLFFIIFFIIFFFFFFFSLNSLDQRPCY